MAAAEAIADTGLDPVRRDARRTAVVCGSAHGGTPALEANHHRHLSSGEVSAPAVPMMLPNMAQGELAIRFRAWGPNLSPALGYVRQSWAVWHDFSGGVLHRVSADGRACPRRSGAPWRPWFYGVPPCPLSVPFPVGRSVPRARGCFWRGTAGGHSSRATASWPSRSASLRGVPPQRSTGAWGTPCSSR
ncbi:beta-ketoacyl synthase N-terminal-like domain-containing protein [Streptomyces roseirectus]|uniref:beta-ketoacyl synthase N-terminal-like domain-containing protein n=1 Tax=Streptomyces roseirectus TaxID=2768066 RepID=UPI003CCD6466